MLCYPHWPRKNKQKNTICGRGTSARTVHNIPKSYYTYVYVERGGGKIPIKIWICNHHQNHRVVVFYLPHSSSIIAMTDTMFCLFIRQDSFRNSEKDSFNRWNSGGRDDTTIILSLHAEGQQRRFLSLSLCFSAFLLLLRSCFIYTRDRMGQDVGMLRRTDDDGQKVEGWTWVERERKLSACQHIWWTWLDSWLGSAEG